MQPKIMLARARRGQRERFGRPLAARATLLATGVSATPQALRPGGEVSADGPNRH